DARLGAARANRSRRSHTRRSHPGRGPGTVRGAPATRRAGAPARRGSDAGSRAGDRLRRKDSVAARCPLIAWTSRRALVQSVGSGARAEPTPTPVGQVGGLAPPGRSKSEPTGGPEPSGSEVGSEIAPATYV